MPTVFISYSWESPEHRAWVRQFATDLRSRGVETWLDQWEVQLGDDVTQFMERCVSHAEYVILVCTENFALKANERSGGVGYEQAIVTAELLNSQATRGRFICALRQGTPSLAIPSYMQTRLWVDLRSNEAYAGGLEQILMHVFRRYDDQKPALAPTQVLQPPKVASVGEDQPRCWVLVAGTGAARGFSQKLEDQCHHLGESLAHHRCGLVTGGWPGVDEWVARAFSRVVTRSSLPLEDALLQVVVQDEQLPFTAGQVVFVHRGDEEWNEPIRRADIVLLLGGLGGTLRTGEIALRAKKVVLPLPDTGGDAKKLYIQMLQKWEGLQWMGLKQKEFQRLGRPETAGIDAAVELALRVGAGPGAA